MKSLKAMITGLFLVGCTSSVTYQRGSINTFITDSRKQSGTS